MKYSLSTSSSTRRLTASVAILLVLVFAIASFQPVNADYCACADTMIYANDCSTCGAHMWIGYCTKAVNFAFTTIAACDQYCKGKGYQGNYQGIGGAGECGSPPIPKCSLPTSSDDGTLNYDSGLTNPCSSVSTTQLDGSTCTAKCADGFDAVTGSSPATLTCDAVNNRWTGLTCRQPCTVQPTSTDYPHVNFNPTSNVNYPMNCGSIASNNKLTYGSSCNAQCDTAKGFILDGSAVNDFKCENALVNGKYQASLTSTIACKLSCSVPPQNYATNTYQVNLFGCAQYDNNIMPSGTSCNVQCQNGYQLKSGSLTLSCDATNGFSGMPTCAALQPCTSLPVAGYKVDLSSGTCSSMISTDGKVADGVSCTYGCRTGYKPRSASVTCENGQYTSIPECVGYPLPSNVFFYATKINSP